MPHLGIEELRSDTDPEAKKPELESRLMRLCRNARPLWATLYLCHILRRIWPCCEMVSAIMPEKNASLYELLEVP